MPSLRASRVDPRGFRGRVPRGRRPAAAGAREDVAGRPFLDASADIVDAGRRVRRHGDRERSRGHRAAGGRGWRSRRTGGFVAGSRRGPRRLGSRSSACPRTPLASIAAAVRRRPINYVAIGPVFRTSTKISGYEAVGLGGVASRRRPPVAACRSWSPSAASTSRQPEASSSGRDAVAVISDLLATGDPVHASATIWPHSTYNPARIPPRRACIMHRLLPSRSPIRVDHDQWSVWGFGETARNGGTAVTLAAILLDGIAVAQQIRDEVARASRRSRPRRAGRPGLALVLVGEESGLGDLRPQQAEVRRGERAAGRFRAASGDGVARRSAATRRPAESQRGVTTASWCSRRCPKAMGPDAERRVFDAIAPEKDVDGFHPVNVGRLVQNRRGARRLHAVGRHRAARAVEHCRSPDAAPS